jgi:outer membrane lipoprotein-sorting protein
VRGVQVLLKLSKLACFALAVVIVASAQSLPSAPPDLNTIVARMMAAQQRNKLQARAFTVKRDYQLLDKTQAQKAQVVAHITYMPPDQKQYRIESSYGGLGEKILRDVLEKETEQPRDPDRKALSAANYNFELLRTEQLDGTNCYVLGLNPKRDDKELIRGKLWVDTGTYNIRRIEGNPAKNPSWWIRDLHFLMSFAEVDGMWLRTFTYAVANVRFKGKYEMVSRDLEYSLAPEQVVRRFRRRARPGIVTGAALNP